MLGLRLANALSGGKDGPEAALEYWGHHCVSCFQSLRGTIAIKLVLGHQLLHLDAIPDQLHFSFRV